MQVLYVEAVGCHTKYNKIKGLDGLKLSIKL